MHTLWLSNGEGEEYNTAGQEGNERVHRLNVARSTLQPVAHCNSLLLYQKSTRSSECSTGTVALESLTPRLNPLLGTGDKNPGQVMKLSALS